MKKTLYKAVISKIFVLSLYVVSFITTILPVFEVNAFSHPVIVLCYHHITDEPMSNFPDTKAIIPKEEFENQMKYLYENGYHTATLSEIQEFLYNKLPLPEKTVLITFDDGYKSVYDFAYPVLKKYGFKSVVFLVGSSVQKDENSKEVTRLKHLYVKQIQEMYKSGVFEFGSHTFNLHNLVDKKSLLTLTEKEEINKDFQELNRFFKEMGLPEPKAIAYPYGQYNKTLIEISKKYYKLGFTVSVRKGTINKGSDPYTLKRIIVPPGTSQEAFSLILKGEAKKINITPKYPNITRLIIKEKEHIKSYLIESFTKGNSNFVAAKAFFAPLGVETRWDEKSKSIIFKNKDITLRIFHPSGNAEINGNPLDNIIEVTLKNGKAFILPEKISNYLGFNLKKKRP